jgi:hypothetical protein
VLAVTMLWSPECLPSERILADQVLHPADQFLVGRVCIYGGRQRTRVPCEPLREKEVAGHPINGSDRLLDGGACEEKTGPPVRDRGAMETTSASRRRPGPHEA